MVNQFEFNSTEFAWPTAGNLKFDRNEVHVWRASLEATPRQVQELKSTLAPDERERADRFHFERHQRRFIVARGTLRALLGRYLHMEPANIRFQYGTNGKPAIDNEDAACELRFNLAHARELVLYAVTLKYEVGVDVEYVRADLARDEIATRFFSEREVSTLSALPVEEKPVAFFNCWTRKEALLKCCGAGLSLPLDRFDVSLAPGKPAALVSLNGDKRAAKRWSLCDLQPGAGYVAALALEGPIKHIRRFQWNHWLAAS